MNIETGNAAWTAYVQRKRAQEGDRLDLSSIEAAHPAFRAYFQAGTRVRVVTEYESGERYERTGTVSVTTGWRPSLLLVHRSNAHGSSDLIGPRERITHVQHGRTYVPVESVYTFTRNGWA